MRLFMVPSFYEADDTSYEGVFLKDQAQSLAGSGLDVVVAYPDLKNNTCTAVFFCLPF